MNQTRVLSVELDVRELRALRWSASLSREIFAEELTDHSDLIPLPDGRMVYPLDSALMKLETVLVTEGEDL